jgi:single-strand DNA-binding protein
MRVAVNSRRKDASGNWVDKPNYFDVTVFGAQGENCSTYLSKGRPVAIEGRLDWREWEAKDGSGKRQAVSIIANTVQFLGSRDGGGENGGNRFNAQSDVPADTSDFDSPETPAAVGASDDDIPF